MSVIFWVCCVAICESLSFPCCSIARAKWRGEETDPDVREIPKVFWLHLTHHWASFGRRGWHLCGLCWQGQRREGRVSFFVVVGSRLWDGGCGQLDPWWLSLVILLSIPVWSYSFWPSLPRVTLLSVPPRSYTFIHPSQKLHICSSLPEVTLLSVPPRSYTFVHPPQKLHFCLSSEVILLSVPL